MWPGNIMAVGLTLALALGLGFHWLAAWLLAVNLVAFAAYGLDKRLARRGRWRISEADLLYYTLIGGTIGAALGMKLFRHKTRKASFRRGYWAIVAAQLLLIGVFGWLKFR